METQQELRPDSGGTGAGEPEGHESRTQPTPDPEQSPKLFIWRYQVRAEQLYQNDKVQYVVATLIVLNFLTNIVEKEIDPYREFHPDLWGRFELFYNIIFTVELALNMYGTWFFNFWQNGWNVFDFIVVAIGLLDTFNAPLPGPLKMLRMMRAFRTFRLFRKVESLNKIVTSLVLAVPGMLNAFFINALFMCIYAVLAVEFFGYSETVLAACEDEHQDVKTGRQLCHGDEYYGSFGRSLYSLFQVLIGDSWSEAVVRPIMQFYRNPVDQFFSVMFFISFMLLNCVVLINVVVAVLLDHMNANNQEIEKGDIVTFKGTAPPANVEVGVTQGKVREVLDDGKIVVKWKGVDEPSTVDEKDLDKVEGESADEFEDKEGNEAVVREFPEANGIRDGIKDLQDKMKVRLRVINSRVDLVNQQVSSLVTVLDSLSLQGGRWKYYRMAA